MTKEEFYNYTSSHNLILSDHQKKQLDRFLYLLVEKNKVMNLTGITEENEVYEKHFLDSLLFSFNLDLNNKTLIDVGTGAGFPGLVLAICYPTLKVTLLDALNKRCNFLNEVVTDLQLNNVKVVCARSEEYASFHREEYDFATARAVAALNVLLEICTPLIKINGLFIALKAKSGKDELESSKNALKVLNLSINIIQEEVLPTNKEERFNIFIQKNQKTDKNYPRQFAKIKKKPL